MLYVAVACLLAWAIPRRFGHKWAFAALILVAVLTSSIVVNDVRTAGVERIETGPPEDRTHAVVYYESTALFPFVIQRQQNLTSRQFFYRVLLLSQDGRIMYETGYADDQSEYMHLARFVICVEMCFVGFFVAVLVIVVGEILWWWRRSNGNHMHVKAPEILEGNE